MFDCNVVLKKNKTIIEYTCADELCYWVLFPPVLLTLAFMAVETIKTRVELLVLALKWI